MVNSALCDISAFTLMCVGMAWEKRSVDGAGRRQSSETKRFERDRAGARPGAAHAAAANVGAVQYARGVFIHRASSTA